jgi:hypothetical protein
MTMYQPGIPTGTVNLDVDYQNIQNNFQQLDTTYGVDHIAYSQITNNGYHKLIHMVPVGSIPPVAVVGTGELYTFVNNDGVNNDTSLYFQTSGGRQIKLTGNFAPVVAANGYTSLPGGLIFQWGSTTAVTGSSSINVNFPIVFPNNVFNIQCTVVTDDNSTIRFSVLDTYNTTRFQTSQTASSHFKRLFWTAIGN